MSATLHFAAGALEGLTAAEAAEKEPEAWDVWNGREEGDGRESVRVGMVPIMASLGHILSSTQKYIVFFPYPTVCASYICHLCEVCSHERLGSWSLLWSARRRGEWGSCPAASHGCN